MGPAEQRVGLLLELGILRYLFSLCELATTPPQLIHKVLALVIEAIAGNASEATAEGRNSSKKEENFSNVF